MKARRDLTGERFGRLVAESDRTLGRKRRWVCKCDCGTEKLVWQTNLLRGKSKSCGCLSKELTSARRKRHGLSRTKVWRIWADMRKRCSNPKIAYWKYYGGRGIKVCDRWQVFENFYADMGPLPTADHSIERVDVNGNYEPSNCCWIPRRDQQKNRRPKKLSVTCGQGHVLNAKRKCPICQQMWRRKAKERMANRRGDSACT